MDRRPNAIRIRREYRKMKPPDARIPLLAAVVGLGTAAVVAIRTARNGNERAIRRSFDAWAGGRGSFYDMMDDDAEVVLAGTAPHAGSYRKDAFMRDVAGPLMGRFASPPVPRLRRSWSSGQSVVVEADAVGTTLDRQPYSQAYVFVFEMARGRVSKVTEYLDMAAFNTVWERVSPEPQERRAATGSPE